MMRKAQRQKWRRLNEDNNAQGSLEGGWKDDTRVKGGILEKAQRGHIMGSLESQTGDNMLPLPEYACSIRTTPSNT